MTMAQIALKCQRAWTMLTCVKSIRPTACIRRGVRFTNTNLGIHHYHGNGGQKQSVSVTYAALGSKHGKLHSQMVSSHNVTFRDKGVNTFQHKCTHKISTSSVPFIRSGSGVCQILSDNSKESEMVQTTDIDLGQQDKDMPVLGMVNPYERPAKKCVLCEQDVDLDYKNVRLLSQFVSPHTGRLYGRHITGLCVYMQKRIAGLVKVSRASGYMPYMNKDPRFLKDPKLYDQFKRTK